MGLISKIIKFFLFLSIILIFVLYFLKNGLPSQRELLPELMNDPVQTSVNKAPFQYTQKGVSYKVTPLYSYELYGLVVSQNDNEVWYSRFKKTDPSNTKDYCVLWGKNLETNIYKEMKFRTEEFVCLAEFKENVPINISFSPENLSNNHLLTADENVYRAIRSASVGDQIHFKGYLVNYEVVDSKDQKFSRGTSVSRTDEGMGACETVYIEQFEILKKGNILIRTIFKDCLYAVPGLIALLILIGIVSWFIDRIKPKKPMDMPNRDILLPNSRK